MFYSLKKLNLNKDMSSLQSSDLGHGRILDGGILQKKVTFEILARETRFICVDAQFYGYRQSD